MGIEMLTELVGELCWYVSAGGVTAPSFELVLGKKVPRVALLKNAAHTDEFRANQGAFALLVWCSWRLETANSVLATSDFEQGVTALDGLIGSTVVNANCTGPAWDLVLQFSNGMTLKIFCDNFGPDPSASQNWELWMPGNYVRVGLGGEWLEESE